jgi:hypothetical protein
MAKLTINKEIQRSPVADEVSSLVAVVRPILIGLNSSLKADVVAESGGFDGVKLKMLGRLRRPGDGDVGICYEYAVHDAVKRGEPAVLERVHDALTKHCKVPGNKIESILFGAEKNGTQQLIETAKEILTDDSRLLTGRQAQPPKLKNYLSVLAAAFRREKTRLSLPTSINGLWKADLFLGCVDSDRWVGTSVKINPKHLEAANGLRVAIVPASQGRSDKIYKDDGKRLVVCPLPYDGSFIELFYNGWQIVQQFLAADAKVPGEVHLPTPSHRYVAKLLSDRREFPVVDVVEALGPMAQPDLLETEEKDVSVVIKENEGEITEGLVAPISHIISNL